MSSRRRTLAIAVVSVVALATIATVWFTAPETAAPEPAWPTQQPTIGAAAETPPPRLAQPSLAPEIAEPVSTPPVWEQRIASVLESNLAAEAAGLTLLQMIPTLPPEGQLSAARHTTNLLSDRDYGQALPLLRNPRTPAPVLRVFYEDLLNRADATRLPAIIEIAKVRTHPLGDDARETLTHLLGEDHGDDWPRWDQALRRYLDGQRKR